MKPGRQSNDALGLPLRDSLGEWDHVSSELTFAGEDKTAPLVTIAITTYKRPDFLLEAVSSAIGQDFDQPFEVVVVDNDPGSNALSLLLERIPGLHQRNIRYFVNAENIGMYGNVNRTVPLARGSWLTILHDDDLLNADFLRTMFAELSRDPSIDGIACNKGLLNQRVDAAMYAPLARMTRSYVRELVRGGLPGWGVLASRIGGRVDTSVRRAGYDVLFRGRSTRRIQPSAFFWGPILGNGTGFLFRTEAARALGGFHADEFPASDLYFYARFAAGYHLRHHRTVAATYRIAQNESAKMDTVLGALDWIHRLQLALAGRHVPRWWLRFAPAMIARIIGEYRETWHIDIPRSRVEELLSIRLPPDDPRKMFYLRLLLNGL